MSAVAGQRALRVGREDLTHDSRPGAPNKLAHIVYKTPRPQEMIDWYTEVLDAVLVFANKRIAFLTYDDEHHRIALIKVPWLLRIPGAVWRAYRKFWGLDHVAFAYQRLEQLVATYRRLSHAGIEPVWCINHGPTTSMYYEDPDGHRIELQVDNVASTEQLLGWLSGEESERNPIGIEFDPKVLERLLAAGVPATALMRRGSASTDGQPARAGRRTLRWK